MVVTINNAFVSQDERDFVLSALQVILIRKFTKAIVEIIEETTNHDDAVIKQRLLEDIRDDVYLTTDEDELWSDLLGVKINDSTTPKLLDIIGTVRHPLHETGELSAVGLRLSIVWWWANR